jgi:AAA+ ATPase superfamily predicted ATPase
LVRYRIRDNFFNFWFQFIHSRTSLIEIDRARVLQETKEQIGGLYGKQAEEMVRSLVIADGQLIHPTEAGRWWDRVGSEIDLLAVDEKTESALFCEVKWTNRKIGWDIAEELKRKAGLVQWRLKSRKERFLLVSRSGFTDSCQSKMEEEGILHWDLKEVEKRLKANIY